MLRGSSSGNPPHYQRDPSADELPAEGTVMDANLLGELEAAAAPGRPPRGEPYADERDDSGVALDASDLVEEGDEDGGISTDQHSLPEALGTELEYRQPAGSAPAHVTQRPTEQLPVEESADPYAPTAPVDPYATPLAPPADPYATPLAPPDGGVPLTAQPTMIYRDPNAPSARVLVVGGNDRGREFELTSDEVTIGRGADCDIVLADIAVSRRHVVLFRDGVVFRCRDQRSGNGTSVNGRKVDEVLLANGDQIELGNTVLRFVVTGDAYVAPAAGAAAALPPGYTPATAPPAGHAPAPGYAPQPPAYGQIPAGAPSVATLPPAPYAEEDPFAAAMLPAAAGGAYTPIVAPRGQPAAKGRKAPRGAGATGGGPLTRLTSTRQGKLLTFGSLILAFVLVSAAFVKRVVLPKRRAAVTVTVPAQPAPEAAYEDGVRKFREGDWAGAKVSFETVLAQVPDNQGAKKYAERCDTEIKSRDQLAAAKAALATNDFTAAKAALKDVHEASKASDEATKLARTVPQKEVEALLAAARKLQAEEDLPGAKGKVEQALAVQPDHADAMALKTELDRSKPKTARERAAEERRAKAEAAKAARDAKAAAKQAERDAKARQKDDARREREAGKLAVRSVKEPKEPPPKPIKEPKEPPPKPIKEPKEPPPKPIKEPPEERTGGGPVSDKVAMNHYKAREWGMAIATLKQMAAKQKGKQQTKTLALAEDVRKVGQAFNRAENEAGKNPAGAVGLYEQAAAIDRRVGKGAHGPYLSGKLNKLSRSEAQRALQAGRYEQAYGLVKTAQRYGGDDATTRAVTQGLDHKAKELFERAYQMKGQKPDEAKGLWRRVLKMVPSSSQWYAKAYKYLNESASPRQRDEDE